MPTSVFFTLGTHIFLRLLFSRVYNLFSSCTYCVSQPYRTFKIICPSKVWLVRFIDLIYNRQRTQSEVQLYYYRACYWYYYWQKCGGPEVSHPDRSLQVLWYILEKILQLNMTRLCDILTPNNVTTFKTLMARCKIQSWCHWLGNKYIIELNELLWLYSSVMFATNNVIINVT